MSERKSFDMRSTLLNQLTVDQLVSVANEALNRVTLRDVGEIFFDVGVKVAISMTKEEEEKE